MATQINLNQQTRLADITRQLEGLSNREAEHHIRADLAGGGTRVYTSSKLSLTSVKAFFGFRDALDARVAKREAGLATLKTIIDREYGAGAADRALAAMGKAGAQALKANEVAALQRTLDEQRVGQEGPELAAEPNPPWADIGRPVDGRARQAPAPAGAQRGHVQDENLEAAARMFNQAEVNASRAHARANAGKTDLEAAGRMFNQAEVSAARAQARADARGADLEAAVRMFDETEAHSTFDASTKGLDHARDEALENIEQQDADGPNKSIEGSSIKSRLQTDAEDETIENTDVREDSDVNKPSDSSIKEFRLQADFDDDDIRSPNVEDETLENIDQKEADGPNKSIEGSSIKTRLQTDAEDETIEDTDVREDSDVNKPSGSSIKDYRLQADLDDEDIKSPEVEEGRIHDGASKIDNINIAKR